MKLLTECNKNPSSEKYPDLYIPLESVVMKGSKIIRSYWNNIW